MTSLLAPDLTPADLARKRGYTPRHAATSPRRPARQRKAASRRVPPWLLALAWHMPRYRTWRQRAVRAAGDFWTWLTAETATRPPADAGRLPERPWPAELRAAAPEEVPAPSPPGRPLFPAVPELRDAARLLTGSRPQVALVRPYVEREGYR